MVVIGEKRKMREGTQKRVGGLSRDLYDTWCVPRDFLTVKLDACIVPPAECLPTRSRVRAHNATRENPSIRCRCQTTQQELDDQCQHLDGGRAGRRITREESGDCQGAAA